MLLAASWNNVGAYQGSLSEGGSCDRACSFLSLAFFPPSFVAVLVASSAQSSLSVFFLCNIFAFSVVSIADSGTTLHLASLRLLATRLSFMSSPEYPVLFHS